MLESITKMPTPQFSLLRYHIVLGILDPLPTVLLCSLTINCMSKTRSCTVNADLLVANHDCVNLLSRGMLTQSMLESIDKIPAPQFCLIHCSSMLSKITINCMSIPPSWTFKAVFLHTADEQQRTKQASKLYSRVDQWSSLVWNANLRIYVMSTGCSIANLWHGYSKRDSGWGSKQKLRSTRAKLLVASNGLQFSTNHIE